MKLRFALLGTLAAFATCLAIPDAEASVSASGVYLKIYKFAVSKNADCSNPIIVYKTESPTEIDFTSDPVVGKVTIEDGVYPCVMFEISDQISFAPAADEGLCKTGSRHAIDICANRSLGQGGPGGPDGGGPGDGGPGGGPGGGPMGPSEGAPKKLMLDGSEGSCDAPPGTEDRVVMYLSTASTNTTGGPSSGNAFLAPGADGKNGRKLAEPLVVSGDTVGTFVVDARDRVAPGPDGCDMQPPAFTFE